MHAPTPQPHLRISALTKTFGAHVAADAVSFDLAPGEFLCLLGPSGCGKSTLLRLIAGLEKPDSGSITLAGADITALPAHGRPVNMMFQSYALFPHMSVARNIAYGLEGLGLSRAEKARRVEDLLRLVRLAGFETRKPDRLSGGQRQRVALARALAREPKLLLLDEPLGALDRGLREETQGELRALQRRLGTSFIVVTHDPQEAMALSDRIGVMDRGRLIQIGRPAELYQRPANRFVAGLLGDVNLIEGRLGASSGGFAVVETAIGPLRAVPSETLGRREPGRAVVLAVRPERLATVTDELVDGEGNAVSGSVLDTANLGDRIRHDIRMADGSRLRVSARLSEKEGARIGDRVTLAFPATAALVLPA